MVEKATKGIVHMSKWSKLNKDQKSARIKLVEEQISKTSTNAEAARALGISRQQLNGFCNDNNINTSDIRSIKE